MDLCRRRPASAGGREVGAIEVGIALFGPYLIGVELAAFLLLGALVGAFHLGRREQEGALMAVPYTHGLVLAAILFSIGLTGLLARRNLIFVLMSIEVMLNAARPRVRRRRRATGARPTAR